MALRGFNTLTRRKEDLAPARGGEMRIYVCGVTVYDVSHIGHGRSAIVFDVIRRYLRHRGYAVKFVKNFTDIDDKIIRRANQEGRHGPGDLRALHRGVPGRHGVARRAARRRRAQGHRAHPADDRADRAADRRRASPTRSTATCTSRSGASPRTASSRARTSRTCRRARGSRSTSASATRSTSRSGRRPSRASRRGRARGATGRPGWHIECSAMAMQYLGETARHPRRRRGPDLPAPRERDRAVARPPPASPSRATGCTTAS